MSNEIKVGDVCVFVPPSSADLVGIECTVVGPEQEYRKTISDTDACEIVLSVFGFMVLAANGRRIACARECLRKKPPKGDNSQRIRQETVPRERFDQWLETVRRRGKVEEPA